MKQNAQFIIIGLWAALASCVEAIIEKWAGASTGKQVLMVSLSLLLAGISLDLVVRYKPDNLLNPYLAGPKTKALFVRKPLLAGFVSMSLFVLLMVAITRIIG